MTDPRSGGTPAARLAEAFTKQDREAILYNARNPLWYLDAIMPLTLERYEATVVALEAEVASLREQNASLVTAISEAREALRPFALSARWMGSSLAGDETTIAPDGIPITRGEMSLAMRVEAALGALDAFIEHVDRTAVGAAAREAAPSGRCDVPAEAFIPRWGMSWACALPKGHTGPHQRGGTCFTHGAYIGTHCTQCVAVRSPLQGEGDPNG